MTTPPEDFVDITTYLPTLVTTSDEIAKKKEGLILDVSRQSGVLSTGLGILSSGGVGKPLKGGGTRTFSRGALVFEHIHMLL